MNPLSRPLTLFLIMLLCLSTLQGQAQFIYSSPADGSVFINPEQTITLKADGPLEKGSLADCQVELQGSQSGHMEFALNIREGEYLFIDPIRDFILGENVEVTIGPGLRNEEGMELPVLTLSFRIKPADNLQWLTSYYLAREARGMDANPLRENTGMTVGDNNYPPDYPTATVDHHGDLSHAYYFFNVSGFQTPKWGRYIHILDEHGIPVFYMKDQNLVRELKIMGNGLLTYGYSSGSNPASNNYRIMDSAFYHLDTVSMGNGYFVDTHDMKWMANGHYLMMAYDPQPVDMSLIVPGGNPEAVVTGLVIQEVDTDGNVYFQWRSWDHFEITDATEDIDLTAVQIDYVHANAFDIDLDGHIILSSRHMDEITKINSTTGEIIWRWGLGAKNNQFTFIDDTIGFSHQHDILVLSNGRYTMFDNGNLHQPKRSKGLEYVIDEVNMEATLTYSYSDDPPVFSRARGSFRRFDDGHELICWGASVSPAITEVLTDGTPVLDFHFPDSVNLYRCERHHWATTRFSTLSDTVDFGTFTGYTPKYNIVTIWNPGPDTLTITSSHNHLEDFGVQTALPAVIPPMEEFNLVVTFFPEVTGNFSDVLTLNSDNADNTMRIARQVVMVGRTADEIPPEVTITPADGATLVDLDTDVVFNFDEPVFKAGGGVITLADLPDMISLKTNDAAGEELLYTAQIDPAYQQITVTPFLPLDENHVYYAEIAGGTYEDADGNVQNDTRSSTFTTGEDFGIEEIPMDNLASIYPNPTRNGVMIRALGPAISEISIYSAQGLLIRTIKDPEALQRVETSNLQTGIYLVVIRTMDERWAQSKLVIH